METPLIEVSDISFTYKDSIPVLNNISFEIFEQDFVSVVGKNGSGKSTLIKIITGIYFNNSGSVRINGKPVNKYTSKELAKKISYLPQSTILVDENITVRELLLNGRYAYKNFFDYNFSEEDHSVVQFCIELCGLENIADKYIGNLSGGERQIAFLTLSMVQLDPRSSLSGKILIIDEPLTHLDIHFQVKVLNIVKNLNENKALTVITVIHDLALAMNFSKKILLLNFGELVSFDEPQKAVNNENIKKYFNIDSGIVNDNGHYYLKLF
ncbi:ABC transporter ATP-binding protein [soil metagenome]